MTAAGSEKAHEAMGEVWTAPTLQPASLALHDEFAQERLLVTEI